MSSKSNNPVGRPTKYKKEFVLEIEKYLKTTGRQQMKLPTIEGFAIFIEVSKDSLYEWKKLYPDFSYALEKILLRQVVQLINDGIYGGKGVNATIIKLMLQNNHGMKERSDQTTNDKELPQPILGGLSFESTIPIEIRKKYEITPSTENLQL